MSTNYAPSAKYASLYKGTDGMKGFGHALREMIQTGRDVNGEEKQRWMENRAFFRGEQWLAINPSSGQIRTLARTGQLRSGRRRDTVNRLRPFTEGRLALYAMEKPAFEVVPADQDQQSIDGARQAEKFIDAQWGENGWNVKATFPALARAGEIDGLAYLYVNWNSQLGETSNLPLPFGPDGQPVTDRSNLEALDEAGMLEWRAPEKPLGDVEFRIVRADALAVDPSVVSDWKTCRWTVETRALPKSLVEKIAGRPVDKILDESKDTMGEYSPSDSRLPDVNIDEGEARSSGRRMKGMLVVHEAYITPGGDWPEGAHCIWLDRAPGAPLTAEPWKDEVPYRPFMPKPDGGHIIRSRGTVDDLKPVQIKLNRTYSSLGEWMDKVGNPPVIAPRGSIVGNEIYGAPGGIVEYNVGYDKPEFFKASSEPAMTMSNYIMQLEAEMSEIANQPNAARGVSPGGGVESNVAIINQQQTVEQQLSGSSAELVRMYEWAIGRALKLVGKFYILPRMISSPGVSDAEEFQSFTGEMLKGASRFKIVGSLQPRSKAAEETRIMQYAPLLGDKIAPYLGRLIQGDADGLAESLQLDAQRQKRKNRKLASVVADPKSERVYARFQENLQMYVQALQAAQMMPQPVPTQVPGMPLDPSMAPQPPSPEEQLAARGIQKPRLLGDMRAAGIEVPEVEWQDDPLIQLETLRRWALGDAYEKMPEMVKQLTRELQEELVQKAGQQLAAMASQESGETQGSEAAPKGQPSPPKQPGQPAGTPTAKLPGG
jgi:hypothetical protein